MTTFALNRRSLLAAAALTPFAAHAAPLTMRERISVEVFGAGPDVVFMPGYACARDVWRPNAERLAATHRVHLLHVRGFAGLAPPESKGPVWDPVVADIAAYLRTLRTPAFIGHSMGGATGLRLASEHPGAAAKVLVVDSLPFYSALFNPAATAEMARPFAAQASAGILGADAAQFEAMQTRSATILSKTAATRARIVEWSVASDRQTIATAIGELMTTDLRPALPKIDTPVTVMFAWDAAMGRPADAYDAFWRGQYAGLKGVQFARIDNAFHFIMDDQPAACAAAIDAFLKSA
jgi:pimeloyl-[acyl-carrier protein] methyl ester esterase